MKKPLLILIAFISLLMSCQADKSGLPVVVNNTTLNGTWYLKNEIITGIFAGFTQTPDTLSGFTKSDYYKFNADGTTSFSSSALPTVYTTYYSYMTTQNGATLTIGSPVSGYGPTPYTVNKLTKDSLILYISVTANLGGSTATTNTTYKYAH